MSKIFVDTIEPKTSGNNVKIPNHIVQVVGNTNSTFNGGAASGVVRDDTIPQQSEVHMCVEVDITPKFADSKLYIQACVPGGTQYNTFSVCCLFKDNDGDALQVMPQYVAHNNIEWQWNLTHFMDAGSTATATFKIGLGANSGTIHQNGKSSGRAYGGASASTIVIMEIAQ